MRFNSDALPGTTSVRCLLKSTTDKKGTPMGLADEPTHQELDQARSSYINRQLMLVRVTGYTLLLAGAYWLVTHVPIREATPQIRFRNLVVGASMMTLCAICMVARTRVIHKETGQAQFARGVVRNRGMRGTNLTKRRRMSLSTVLALFTSKPEYFMEISSVGQLLSHSSYDNIKEGVEVLVIYVDAPSGQREIVDIRPRTG